MRSKTSSCTSSRLGYACATAALVTAVGAGCKRDESVASLDRAEGVVSRQKQHGDSAPAAAGTAYFVDDAAITGANGKAELAVAGITKVGMPADTVLRFGRKDNNITLTVERGQAKVGVNLDAGNIEMLQSGATLQISTSPKGGQRASTTLTAGEAQLLGGTGGPLRLEVGKVVELGPEAAPPIDAGVPDAPIDAAAPVDAGEAEPAGATIAVTGRRAEILPTGTTQWKPLPAGAGKLPPGSKVRLGPGTTAEITTGATTLDMAAGAHVALGDDLGLSLEAGPVVAQAAGPAQIALPGGSVALAGAAGAAVETRLDAGPRETKVSELRGGAKLTGAAGAELGLSRGESALLTRNGNIRVLEAIPSFFDLRIPVGESLTIHDPKPPAAVQFAFDGKCPDGGIIEVDRDRGFRTPRISGGKDVANVMLGQGTVFYRLRCTVNGGEGGQVASGVITERADDGRRPLPKTQGVNDIEADGRNYRISYQSGIPNVAVHVGNAGSTHRLHLASAGKEQTFDSTSATILVPASQLREGNYTYWVDRDGVKQDRVSNLVIDFDQTAPQVYIESPINGQAWSGDIDVRGAILTGWSAAVDAIAIPIDGQRRFAAKVGTPPGNALAIRLSHPQRGVHYYLRRQK